MLSRVSVVISQNWWRRGESNPRPKRLTVRSLHVYPSSLTAFASGPKERAITNRRLSSLPGEGLSLRIPRPLIPSNPAKRRFTSLMRA